MGSNKVQNTINRAITAVIETDDTVHFQHFIQIKKIKERVVKCVPSVDVSKLDLLLRRQQLRQRRVVEFFHENMLRFHAGSLDISRSNSTVVGVLARVDGYQLAAFVEFAECC